MKSCQSLLLAVIVSAGTLLVPAQAEGGPLLDWLRGLRQKSCLNRQAPCNTGYTGTAVAQANPYNLQPGQCATTCNQTCARTVVNYVPHTAYRCSWEQVPVTQYKPVTSSDPCTGCSVTCMKPCTTYSWQQKQVPYTTYRAVYRTENYTVPVTTISNSGECSTCAVPGTAGCSTCTVPGSTVNSGTIPLPPAGTTAPTYGIPQPSTSYPYPVPGNVIPPPGSTTSIMAPNGTIPTTGSYSTDPSSTYTGSGVPTPADRVPSIDGLNPQTMQRPILDILRGKNPESNVMNNEPRNAVLPGGVTLDQVNSRSALRRDWGYTPVRLASYHEPVATTGSEWTVSANRPESNRMSNSEPVRIQNSNQDSVNSSWRSVGW